MVTSTVTRTALAVALVVAVPLAGTAPAMAKDDDRREVRLRGDCSGRADWKLKVKERDGGAEVEFEVDSNRSRQRWSYTLLRNGVQIAAGTGRTQGRSGSFSVERRTAGGAATITGRAVNRAGGEVCLGTLRF